MAFSRMLDKFAPAWRMLKTLTRMPQIGEFNEWL